MKGFEIENTLEEIKR